LKRLALREIGASRASKMLAHLYAFMIGGYLLIDNN
jgi:hypothetical protein